MRARRTKVQKDAPSTTPSGKPDDAQDVYRLTDIAVKEVSVVDRAANKKTFVVVKNEPPEELGDAIVPTADGTLTTRKASPAPEPAAPPAAPAPAPAPAAPPKEDPIPPPTDVLKLSPENKAEIVRRVDGAIELLTRMRGDVDKAEAVQGLTDIPQSILDAVNEALVLLSQGGKQTSEKSLELVAKAEVEKVGRKISAAREKRLRAARDVLDEILKELDPPAQPAPEGEPWTVAQVNELPDSSFLLVEEGVAKDSDGRSVPRSKRHFPVRGADGAVDVTNLRIAAASIAGSTLEPTQKASAQAEADKLLAEVEKSTVAKRDAEPSPLEEKIIATLDRIAKTTNRVADAIQKQDARIGAVLEARVDPSPSSSRPESNAAPEDLDRQPVSKTSRRASWPLDMSRGGDGVVDNFEF